MNKEQELENREKQAQELEALEAIFPDDFKKEPHALDAYTFTINIDHDEQLKSPRTLTLTFFLPPTYPNQDMPVYHIVSVYCGSKKVDNAMLDAIDQGFCSLYEPGEIVLFEWISWLNEYLEKNVEKSVTTKQIESKMEELEIEEESTEESTEESAEEPVDDAHDRPIVRALMGAHTTEIPPTIFSSEPLVDRKSIFIAHVAKVDNVNQVKSVVATLLQNKKIAKAAHNILAYRITMPDGKVLQDNDDDGETAAGSRLLHLMQILQVENVVIVVTRWFGGIHLGPDRFKDINNVARTALEEQGFIQKPQNKKNKK